MFDVVAGIKSQKSLKPEAVWERRVQLLLAEMQREFEREGIRNELTLVPDVPISVVAEAIHRFNFPKSTLKAQLELEPRPMIVFMFLGSCS